MRRREERIGTYRIDGYLGGGRIGDVHAAWDEQLRRRVALKRLRPELARDQGLRERFRAAACAAAGLDDPAIVRIHTLIESDGADVVVMELIKGETLARQRGSACELSLALRLAEQIAGGLAAAHARQVPHGDLKAEHVMITLSGDAKILDFGFARQLFGGAAPGSPAMGAAGIGFAPAPEQLAGSGGDMRSDLFALGVLLFEMLTGCSPFGAASPPASIASRRGRRRATLSALRGDVPPSLSDLVERLLLEEPALRPASAAEVALLLRAASAGSPRAAPGTAATVEMPQGQATLPPGASPALRRVRRRGLALSLVAALAATSGAWLLLRSRGEPAICVAVTAPAIARGAGIPGVDLLAMGLQTALLHALATLDGVVPLPPEQVDAVAGPPVAVARAVAASEVMTSRLSCRQDSCAVSLSRISGRDGSLIWNQAVEIPTGEPYLLAAAVEGYVGKEYASRGSRAGARGLAVTPRDFKQYLRLRRDLEGDGRDVPFDTRLAQARALRAGSPRFLEGALLEAALLRRRYTAGRDPADLDRALTVLGEAQTMAPADPRPLYDEMAAALAGRRWERAQAAIGALAQLQPGEPEILAQRARLLEGRGQARQGLELRREAARLRPSWTNLADLAGLESRLGASAAARAHLLQARARLDPATARSLLPDLTSARSPLTDAAAAPSMRSGG